MRLLRFKYTISHVPGKSLVVADTLSRAPVTKHISEHDNRQNEEIELYVNSVLSEVPASDKRLEEIRERQREDEVCRQMVTYCKDGWPERASCPEALKAYWSERNEITLVKSILMKGCRIIIPSKPEKSESGSTSCKHGTEGLHGKNIWFIPTFFRSGPIFSCSVNGALDIHDILKGLLGLMG